MKILQPVPIFFLIKQFRVLSLFNSTPPSLHLRQQLASLGVFFVFAPRKYGGKLISPLFTSTKLNWLFSFKIDFIIFSSPLVKFP